MADAGSTRVRIQVVQRAPRFEGGDDALGFTLLGLLEERLPRGVPRPAMFVFREDRVEIVDLVPLLGGPDLHCRVACFAGQEGVEAIALVGVIVRERSTPKEHRFGSVFVEWTDGRWWAAWRSLGRDVQVDPAHGPWVQRAIDRIPRPAGFGAWFSRARFQGLKVRLELQDQVVH